MKKLFILVVLSCSAISLFSQVTAQGGYALDFDGTNDYVTADGICSEITSTFTIETWLQFEGAGSTQMVWAINENGTTNNILILGRDSDNHLRMFHYDGGNTTFFIGSTVLSTNTWYHVAMTIGSGSINLYLNGTLEYSGSKTVTVASDDLFSIGQEWDGSPSDFFNGKIDEFRVWNDVRTQDEVCQNMFKELAGNESGLVSYFKMNEGSGSVLNDNSTNSHNGTIINDPAWNLSGCFGGSRQALDFDGSDDYVQIPSDASLNNNTFSVEFWLKMDDTPSGWDGLIDKGRYSAGNEWYFLTIQGSLAIMFGIQGVNEIWFGIDDNNWHHITGTYDGSVMKAYVDGSLVGTASGSYTATSNAIRMGQTLAGFNSANIRLDEVRMWNTARTETQIHDNMMKTLSGNETGLVAYYRMDHYDGTTLYDLTSNTNNGTLTNMTVPSCWVSSDAFNTWIGTEDNSWNNAGNWTNGAPASEQSLGFYNTNNGVDFSLNSSLSYNSLYLSSVNSLTLNTGTELSLSGCLINNAEITIKSSASGDASLLVDRDISGSGGYNVERYLSGSQWHLVTSPITNGLSGVFQDIWLRPYDEATNAFGDYIVPTTTPMPTGQGFSVWADNNETRTFSGTINHGSVGPLSVQLTGSAGPNTGWNLIGNPYPSAIDWDAASGWSRTSIADAVYVWNNTQYSAYVGGIPVNGGSRYVAQGQGFFVQATSSGATIGMDNGIRLHNSVSFMKSSNSEPDNVIRIQLSGNGYSDEAVIAIRDADPDAFDPDQDAYKLTGSSSAPQMYILKDDMSNLSIASFSDIEDIEGRAVYMDYAQEGQHTISWTHSITGAVIPALLDQLTGDIIEPGTNYTYDASDSDMPQRFVFSTDPLSVIENDHSIAVWEYDNTLFINSPGYNKNNVSIYNMQGVMIFRGEGNRFDLNFLAPAMYIVKVRTGDITKTEKIVIK